MPEKLGDVLRNYTFDLCFLSCKCLCDRLGSAVKNAGVFYSEIVKWQNGDLFGDSSKRQTVVASEIGALATTMPLCQNM